MGRQIPEAALEKLKSILDRMELRLNEEKTKLVQAREESFDFLGFTVRYDRDLYGTGKRYWNIVPSKKSCVKVRGKLKEYLRKYRHCNPLVLTRGMNPIIRGWVNYFWIPGVSYPQAAKKNLKRYLLSGLRRYYRRKSQRKSRLYRRNAFDVLVKRYGLIDPSNKMLFGMPPVKVHR